MSEVRGTLYFQRSNGEKVIKAVNVREDEVGRAIKDVVGQMNPKFKIYYTRAWKSSEDPNTTVYDVGSHTEFFLFTRSDKT